MPSDANGVYSLPTGYLAETGETIQASQHNPPLEDLASSMSARLMRSGAAPMTGPLKVVDGSAGSPAVQFSNGTSTGIYKTANGVGISVGGTKVAEFGPGGALSGARWIGELVPFTGLTAPALTVLPYGQTLSRTTYAALWAFAQTEIANGNTFYNNGDGSTTFGIGDMRGRVVAGKDNMGGTLAGRLGGGAGMGGTPTILGFAGGLETHTLTLSQAPSGITSSNPAQPISVLSQVSLQNGGGLVSAVGGGGISVLNSVNFGTVTSAANNSISVTSNNTGGAAHNNVQPTMITNYILFAGA